LSPARLSAWELRWNQQRDRLDDKTDLRSRRGRHGIVPADGGLRRSHCQSGAKLVLVGDPEQLQPIEAGAAFRAIADRDRLCRARTIYRQREHWMRNASLDLARGNVGWRSTPMRIQYGADWLRLKAEAIERLIADWNRDYDPTKTTLILAHLRRDVRHAERDGSRKAGRARHDRDRSSFKTADGQGHFDAAIRSSS
jgi:hypothetical protein